MGSEVDVLDKEVCNEEMTLPTALQKVNFDSQDGPLAHFETKQCFPDMAAFAPKPCQLAGTSLCIDGIRTIRIYQGHRS